MYLIGSRHRKPYISVYEGGAAAMVGEYVRSWNENQRSYREYRIQRTQGFKPLYRINLKVKGPVK